MRIVVPVPISSLMHLYASGWKKLRAATASHAPVIAPMPTTRIDGQPIPIEPGPKTIISFSGGESPGRTGRWEFWTLMGPSGAAVTSCHEGADPGERFSRMGGQRELQYLARKSRFAFQLHPATVDELESWMNSHPEHVPHARSGELGGAKVRVVKDGRRYRVVSDNLRLRFAMPKGILARS